MGDDALDRLLDSASDFFRSCAFLAYVLAFFLMIGSDV